MSARQKKDPIDFSAVAPPADQVALSRTRQGFAPARMMAQEKQSLQDRVIELEQQIAQVREEATATRQEAEANAAQLREAEAELVRLKSVAEAVQNRGEGGSELLLLDPATLTDACPPDRFPVAFADKEFHQLVKDIKTQGQLEPISVRVVERKGDTEPVYQVVSGRRRIAVCVILGIRVLARAAVWSDEAVLDVQFAENERRAGVSVLERAFWIAEVQKKTGQSAGDIAKRFGYERSHIAHMLRLVRLPQELLQRLRDPRNMKLRVGRQFLDLFSRDDAALQRALDALEDLSAKAKAGDKRAAAADDIAVALKAAANRQPKASPERRPIYGASRQLGHLVCKEGRWQLTFEVEMTDEEIEALHNGLGEAIERVLATSRS